MKKWFNIFEWIKAQKQTFESFGYKEVKWSSKKEKYRNFIKILYLNKLIKNSEKRKRIEKPILEELENRKLNFENIIWTKFEDNKIYIYLDNWENFSISYLAIQNSIFRKSDKIWEKIVSITKAIDSIYEENKWIIINDEINNYDIITDEFIVKYSLNKSFKWKNLLELKSILDIEKRNLFKISVLTWSNKKYLALLKFEVEYFMWTTDKTEGSARYHSMNNNWEVKEESIRQTAWEIVNTMEYPELIKYIRKIHADIDDNLKKSDIVTQVNSKLLDSLYVMMFDKLKKEKAETKDFIELVKVMTWRWVKINKKGEDFEYESLEWDTQFRDIERANEIMIYIMERPWWIIEKLVKEKNWINNVEVKDEKLNWETPAWILKNAHTTLEKFWKVSWKSSNEILIWLNFEELIWINKEYNKLTFEEKIKLWALFRMLEIIWETTPEDIEKDPKVLLNALWKTLNESKKWIHESLENQFDKNNWFSWNDAKDLGLEWDLAEMFDLYQNINWNLTFDLSDDNWFNNITLSWTATVALWILTFWVAIYFLPATAWVLAILWTWAAAWAITSLIWQVLSWKWYDSFQEGFNDILFQTLADSAIWAAFFWLSIFTFAKLGINILTKDFFTKASASDLLIFGWGETIISSMVLSPYISTEIKNYFLENHFDTDLTSYQEQIAKKENNTKPKKQVNLNYFDPENYLA